MLAVEFDAQGVLAAGGVAGGLEGGEGAGGEAAGEQGGVVDGDLPGGVLGRPRRQSPGGFGARRQRAAAYERLGERGDPGEWLPRQVLGEVDDVGAEVAECAGTGPFPAQPPGQWGSGVRQPVLEVRRPYVPQPAEAPLGDHAAGQCGGRDPPVVEADHREPAAGLRLLGGAGHRLGLRDRVGQRFLAQDVFAGGECGQGDVGVAVAGGADVDEVDVLPRDEGPPVGLGARPAVPFGGPADRVGVPSAERGRDGAQREVEDPVGGAPGLGVGGAHEGVAHHADAQGRSPPLPRPVLGSRLCHAEVLLVVVARRARCPRPGSSGSGAAHLKPVDMYWSTFSLSTTAE